MIKLEGGLLPSIKKKKTQEEKRLLAIQHSTIWQKNNKEKVNAKNRTWRKKHREQYLIGARNYYHNRGGKERMIEREHGVTPEQYQIQLIDQKYKCAICKITLDLGKHTHQDHSHSTKIPRGILCHSCNLGIGHFKDSIELMQQAINYLKKYEDITL